MTIHPPIKRLINVEEYYRMAEIGILKQDDKVELINGEIYTKHPPTKRLINVEEYYRMAEAGILKPDDKVELINGKIYTMSPINARHAACVNMANALFSKLLDHQAIVAIQNPIQLNLHAEPEPDIALLKPSPDFYASHHPTPADIFLLIEVAFSSAAFDRTDKLVTYAAAGIPEYWLIDLNLNQLEVYQQPSGEKYKTVQIFQKNQVVHWEKFKLDIKVERLIPPNS